MNVERAADPDRSGGPTRTLMRGLAILRLLVDAHQPLSASEIGRHFGMHQSSVSRILATLAAEGYVRRTGYRSFVPDYGVLALGVAASQDFRLATVPLAAMEEAARLCDGLRVSLCMLWRDQMIYLMRTQASQSPIPFSAVGYPLHLSAPALRFMMDMPDPEAIRLLEASRQRHGWTRPTDRVPENAPDVLREIRHRYEHDCVTLEGWVAENRISAAITVRDRAEEHPLAIALTGPSTAGTKDKVLLWLHEARRMIESALSE